MFKKMIITVGLLLNASLSYASTCFELDLKNYPLETELEPRWSLAVNSSQPVYFYSAPSTMCKMEGDYVIHNDQVIAYSLYTDKSNEEWVYVMYANTEHDSEDSDELVEGWVKLKDFKRLDQTTSVK